MERTGTVWFAHWARAIAMVLVVWVHLFIAYWSQNPVHAPVAHVRPDPAAATRPAWSFLFGDFSIHLGYGTAAVGTFFLISGFVIPMTLENRSVGRFVFARVCRVYPTWIAGLALIAVVLWIDVHLTGDAMQVSARDWLLNAALVPDLGRVPLINPVCWTLLIEVKFYALCALLAATVGLHRAAPLAAVAVGLSAVSVLIYGKHTEAAATDPWVWNAGQVLAWGAPYVCITLVGVCFYNHFRGMWSTVQLVGTAGACFAAGAVSLLVVHASSEYRVALTVGILAAVPIFAVAYTLRRQIPSNRLINALAEVSYPLYVLHYIVGFQLIALIVALGGSPIVASVGACAVTLAAAAAVHRWVERPSTRFGKDFRRVSASG